MRLDNGEAHTERCGLKDDVAETGMTIASGKMDYNALLQWVKEHRI